MRLEVEQEKGKKVLRLSQDVVRIHDRMFHNFGASKSGDWRAIPRRALLQLWSFKIRRSTFLNYLKFVDPRILLGCVVVQKRRSTDFEAPKLGNVLSDRIFYVWVWRCVANCVRI